MLFALGTTRKEQVSSSVIDTRVSSQQASLDGTLCYVDQRSKVTARSVVPRQFRPLAGGAILGGLLIALLGKPALYIGAPMLADGILTVIYIKIADEQTSTRSSWDVSNETAGCR